MGSEGGCGVKFLLKSVCFYLTNLSVCVFGMSVCVSDCVRDPLTLSVICKENTTVNYFFKELV